MPNEKEQEQKQKQEQEQKQKIAEIIAEIIAKISDQALQTQLHEVINKKPENLGNIHPDIIEGLTFWQNNKIRKNTYKAYRLFRIDNKRPSLHAKTEQENIQLHAKTEQENIQADKKTATGEIQYSCNQFHQYFSAIHPELEMQESIDALKGSGAFAINMISHLDNLSMVENIMFSYCTYIQALSQKPKEEQAHFLQSFPPKTPNEIQCLGGTGSRLEALIGLITNNSQEDKILIEINQNLISQLTNNFTPKVDQGNQVHIPTFLSYAFGFKSKDELQKIDNSYLTPQPEIEAPVLFRAIIKHYSNFKAELSKEMEGKYDQFADLVREIDKENPEFTANYLVYNSGNNDIKPIISNLTENIGAEKIGDLVEDRVENGVEESKGQEDQEDQEDQDFYVYSPSKISELLLKKYLPKIYQHILTNPQTKDLANQASIDFLAKRAALFDENAPKHITALLESEDTEEVKVGVEALWVLAKNFKHNSPIQVIETHKSINAGFLAGLEQKLADDPNYKDKVTEIQESINGYQRNQEVQDYLNIVSSPNNPENKALTLDLLLKVGANTQEMIKFIDEKSYDTMPGNYRREDHLEILADSKIPIRLLGGGLNVMAKESNLIAVEKILNKFTTGDNLEGRMIEFGSGKDILDAIATNPEIKNMSSFKDKILPSLSKINYPHILITEYRLNNIQSNIKRLKTMKDLGIDLNSKYDRNPSLKSTSDKFQGETPAHIAAIRGNLQYLIALDELGADFNIGNNNGTTALNIAINSFSTEVKKWAEEKLEEMTKKIQEAQSNQETPNPIIENADSKILAPTKAEHQQG